ncbi:DUF3883 domain-containing protein [Aeromicrobium fastidiosum]|uniref:protein NO VEIN domain-containing protein n=1 Tax=Aeromicrobium fastidiosum TaxID=52699 RepID=UPI0020237B28|nr:DUF3883 domain-containing protein [Aeromicrobium fastidiosum]MCL8251355.1 DUF3883 domain-containing protein [Aeromicrobium fastidiosum]
MIDAANSTSFAVQVNWFFGDRPGIETTQNISLSAKNWRLNSMPWVQVDVEPGVIIVCQILGDEPDQDVRVPTGAAFALLRAGDQGFAWLDAQLPAGGFVDIEDAALLAAEDWTDDSSVRQLINFLTLGLYEIVEDVIGEQTTEVIPRVGLRSLDRTGSTHEAIAHLSSYRSAIGLGGETLVDAVLEQKLVTREFHSYEWVSSRNATAPVDFRASLDGVRIGIEVKTTRGPHRRKFHISTAELNEAQQSRRFEIWRVSQLDHDAEQIRGAIRRADPSELVDETLLWIETTPTGVSVPGVAFDPAALNWTDPESAECSVERVPSPTWASDMDIDIAS